MLSCVKPSSSRKPNVQLSVPSKHANSDEDTPPSSTQPSPTIDITHEYNLYIQSSFYGEIRSKIHSADRSSENHESMQVEPNIVIQILNPSQECVQETLQHAKPGKITRLASAYFEHSEATYVHCVSLFNSVHRARSLYRKLQNLLSVLPLDLDSNSLSDTQCAGAFDAFIEFSSLENPFPCPESCNFHNISDSFSDLNKQLNQSLSKSCSKVGFLGYTTTCTAVCLVGAAVGVTIGAVVIAMHALPALVAAPLLPACLLSGTFKDEVASLSLDAAARGTLFFHYGLSMIDCLVYRSYTDIEDDRDFIRLGLAGGCDRHPVYLVAKRLHKNHNNFHDRLGDLEESVRLCIIAINETRSKLLEEIHRHQSRSS